MGASAYFLSGFFAATLNLDGHYVGRPIKSGSMYSPITRQGGNKPRADSRLHDIRVAQASSGRSYTNDVRQDVIVWEDRVSELTRDGANMIRHTILEEDDTSDEGF